MRPSNRQADQEHAALARIIHVSGAVLAVAAMLAGCGVLFLILLGLFRMHPLLSAALFTSLLGALYFFKLRRTGFILAVILAVGGCYFFGCLLVARLRGQPQFSNFGWFGKPAAVLGTLALGSILGALFWSFAQKGYDMWQRIDRGTLADFASIFALFATRVFYYFLPSRALPNSHALVVCLSYYAFYRVINWTLFRVFDLNRLDPAAPPPFSTEYLPQN
jgi:hypothetical protein